MTRGVVTCLLTVLLVALGTVEARAVTAKWRPVAVVRSLPVSDSVRYLAYQATDGSTAIVDTTASRSLRVATPAGCQAPVAVGGGQVLWPCYLQRPGEEGRLTPMLFDIASRRLFIPRGADALQAEIGSRYDTVSFLGVGQQWVEASEQSLHGRHLRYVNWHTGALADAPANPSKTIDLNKAGLQRSLCRPIRRSDVTDPAYLTTDPLERLMYDGKFAVSTDVLGQSLTIRRCGQRDVSLSTHCNGQCQPQLGSGVLTWTKDESHIGVYDEATRRSLSVAVPEPPGRALHTSTSLYRLGTLPRDPRYGTRFRLYSTSRAQLLARR